MTTVSRTMTHYREEQESGFAAAQQLFLFFAAPFVGLAYVVAYALVIGTAVICFGLKAFGVRCGVFKR